METKLEYEEEEEVKEYKTPALHVTLWASIAIAFVSTVFAIWMYSKDDSINRIMETVEKERKNVLVQDARIKESYASISGSLQKIEQAKKELADKNLALIN